MYVFISEWAIKLKTFKLFFYQKKHFYTSIKYNKRSRIATFFVLVFTVSDVGNIFEFNIFQVSGIRYQVSGIRDQGTGNR